MIHELRNADGTVYLCDIDFATATVTAIPAEEPRVSPAVSPMDFDTARYDIEQVIGRGGFAAVVRARDRKLGRIVALKIPQRDHAAVAIEGELASQLQHPNIVPIYDADVGSTVCRSIA